MNFYVTEDEKRLIDERIRLPPTRSIRQIRTDSFPQHRIHVSLYIFLQCLLLRISTLCLLTIKVLKNLLHLPTSANFRQDTALHILMVHQLQGHLMHNPIRGSFQIFFRFPAVNAKHISSTCVNINTIVIYVVFCINCSHRILSPFSFDNQL